MIDVDSATVVILDETVKAADMRLEKRRSNKAEMMDVTK